MSRKTHEEERYVYTNTVAVASLLDWSIGEAEEGDERGRWSFIDFFVSCRHLLFFISCASKHLLINSIFH
jgi:hypothetical protein